MTVVTIPFSVLRTVEMVTPFSPAKQRAIRELNYYRRAIFVADPGPTSQELQTLAAAVVDEFDTKV